MPSFVGSPMASARFTCTIRSKDISSSEVLSCLFILVLLAMGHGLGDAPPFTIANHITFICQTTSKSCPSWNPSLF